MVKIVEDTDQRTVIEDTPWVFGLFLILFTCLSLYGIIASIQDADWPAMGISMVMALACGLMLRFGIRRVRLTLTDNAAELVTRDFSGTKRQSFPRTQLRAGLATDYTDGETYRVILLVDGNGTLERIPLTPYLSSASSHSKAVTRINAWSAAT